MCFRVKPCSEELISNLFDYHDSTNYYIAHNLCEKFLYLRKSSRKIFFVNGDFKRGWDVLFKLDNLNLLY